MWHPKETRSLILVAVAAVCLSAGAGAQQAPKKKPANPHVPRGEKHEFERQVTALEEQWRQASLTGDVATMDRLLADDYIGISWTGLVSDKQQQLERLRTRTAVPTKIDVSDRKVKVLGTTVIVTSRVTTEGTANEGTFRYTRIYSRQANGAWKIVNFESTRILPRPPGGSAPSPPGPPPSGSATH